MNSSKITRFKWSTFYFLLSTVLALAGTASAKTIYVDSGVSPGGGGTNWTDAYKYLQDALADADISVKPIEIRVAQGVYIPDQNSANPGGTGDREAKFQLINGVALEGGYAGDGETDPDARETSLYETTLSGDLDGDDGPNFANNNENTFHVVTGSGIDTTAVLDGFTITGGNANGSSSNAKGGGMYMFDNSSPMVLNCTFNNNYAYNTGGGIHTMYMTLTDCTFTYNTAGSGGGIYSQGESVLTNCTFDNNSSSQYGGGMCSVTDDSILINCTFTNNSSSEGGGGIYNYYGSPTLTNCTFSGNSARIGGGFRSYLRSDLTLTNCTFSNNSASDYGGGFYNHRTNVTLTNCMFSGNQAGTDGGGYHSTHDYATFTNCTFSENSADGDGGAYCITTNGGTTDFNNCILWGNTASNEGPQIAIKTAGATVGVNYSDVQGGELDIYVSAGTLNYDVSSIDVDPLFVDADGPDDTVGTEDDNLRLLTGSPCIDAGDNTAVPAGINDDLNGFPRFIDDLCTVDTGNGTAPVVDIGAYEFLRSDIDSDGDVNLGDFSQFALYWLDVACGACGGADLTCDGDVDIDDLKELAEDWLR